MTNYQLVDLLDESKQKEIIEKECNGPYNPRFLDGVDYKAGLERGFELVREAVSKMEPVAVAIDAPTHEHVVSVETGAWYKKEGRCTFSLFKLPLEQKS